MSLRTEYKGLHGTYDCVCSEENESCLKSCNRSEVSGYVEKMRNPKLLHSPKQDENKIRTSQTSCCCSKVVLDSKTSEYYCVRKSSSMGSLINPINGCCRCKELQTIQPNHSSTNKSLDFKQKLKIVTSCKVHNPIDQHDIRASLNDFDANTSPQPTRLPAERVSNSIKEEHCYNECFFTRAPGTESDTRELLGIHKLNESCRSIETALTSRKKMDENIIPLLKDIFDVLQSMREDKLHLGSPGGKNVEIQLDEPFNGLPTPPAPLSSPPYLTKNGSFSDPKFEEKSTQYAEDCQNSMEILEPPERDMDSYSQTTSQRLIPVDMGLLRTDDELSWEPDSNFDEPQFEEEETTSTKLSGSNINVDEAVLLKAQFLKFSKVPQSEPSEEPKACTSKYCQGKSKNTVEQDDIEISPQDAFNTNAELSSQLSIRNESSSIEEDYCECVCEDAEQCAADCCRNSSELNSNLALETSSIQEAKLDQKDENEQLVMKFEVSQAIQVNILSLQNLTSRSAQFLKIDSQFEEMSEEKLIKTSKMKKSTEELSPTITSEGKETRARSKLDVGTDNPGFDDEDKNHIKSCPACCYCHQEPTNPQNQDMSYFIESILSDLKAMKNVRENRSQFPNSPRQPTYIGGLQRPSRDLSFPVTIERVQELGKNSLFIKWNVQNIGNIGGYEIFLDGHLTNRYFNCIHKAAVICDVNLHQPHRIILRAQPLLPISISLLTTKSNLHSCSSRMKRIPSDTTHPEASCVQADGSVWYPSVYHFEPNSYLAPTNAVLY